MLDYLLHDFFHLVNNDVRLLIRLHQRRWQELFLKAHIYVVLSGKEGSLEILLIPRVDESPLI